MFAIIWFDLFDFCNEKFKFIVRWNHVVNMLLFNYNYKLRICFLLQLIQV